MPVGVQDPIPEGIQNLNLHGIEVEPLEERSTIAGGTRIDRASSRGRTQPRLGDGDQADRSNRAQRSHRKGCTGCPRKPLGLG